MDTATPEGARTLSDGGLDKGGKYLTFKLGQEEYGLSLIRVREIIALMAITAVPLAPRCVRGVMNLRGRIIPVVDIRERFLMPSIPDHDRKCIIVVDVQRAESSIQMSILVDEVSEVLYIASDEIEDAPPFRSEVNTSFIHGMAKTKSGVKILLNVDVVLANTAIETSSKDSTSADSNSSTAQAV